MQTPIEIIFKTLLLVMLIYLLFFFHKADASTEWTKQTYSKYNNLVSIWFSKDFAGMLINNCKTTTTPLNCIKIGASIAGAESSMANNCFHNNCVGMNDGWKHYSSMNEGVAHWVKQYSKWWYKQKTPSSFYRADGIPPITRYCMWPKGDGVCVNGAKNAWSVFNKLNF